MFSLPEVAALVSRATDFPRDTLRDAAAPLPKNSDTPQLITVMGRITPVAALSK